MGYNAPVHNCCAYGNDLGIIPAGRGAALNAPAAFMSAIGGKTEMAFCAAHAVRPLWRDISFMALQCKTSAGPLAA